MDLSKYKDKGFTGLANLGNTCFLNSCLQILNHTYELNEILESTKCSQTMKPKLQDTTILKEWNNLRKVMWSGNGIVSPNKFVYSVQQIANAKNRDIFTGWAQNDITEFILFIIDCLHNSISRKINMNITGDIMNNTDKMAVVSYEMLKNVYSTEYSEIMEMFYGIYVSVIMTTNEKKTHVMRPEHFFMLNLQIINPDNREIKSLHDCFDLFVESEIMEGENAWFNEKTNKKENIKKKMFFWNFPKVLVITLKRFSPDGTQKLNNLIDFPLENFDLSKYVHGYNPASYVYDLYGVCNHSGGVNGGHYTAFVKNSSDQWIHYNDTHVDIVQNPKSIVTPMAYCLFYRKKNNLL